MKISEWGKNERPRERLERLGAENLSDTELLAILIRTGAKTMNAADLAREILAASGGSLTGLSLMSLERLSIHPGIGKVKAITLKAAFELGRRFAAESSDSFRSMAINDSGRAFSLLYPHLKDLDHEECWVIFLNRGNKVISIDRISKGGSSATIVDRKIILRMAVEKLAGGIILAHNHPSGNRFPGEADIRETRALKEAAKIMDVSLLDHIIIAGNGYYSFSDADNL